MWPKVTLNSVAVETNPESSRVSWRIYNSSNPTSTRITCPVTRIVPNPRKKQKNKRAVISHLPHNTPAEDQSDGLVSLYFVVISVKQMTATRRSSLEEPKIINLPLFVITLPRPTKSQEIFRLPSLSHIAIRVEPYKALIVLTQCHNR
jgi:hypothetical protein